MFDGMLVHIAGGKRGGDFNQRFGQPSASLHPTMSNAFPFNDTVSTDPVTGRSDGLLERLAARRRVPKIFFTNSSTEYWRGDASLIHTDAEGTRDVSPSASSRLYHFAGTQHSAGTLPLTDTNPVDGARGQQALNSVDYNPLLRNALVRMDRWVSGEEDPPPSRYPRLADGTAVAPEQPRGVFTAIPGVGFPAHPPQVVRLDFGPDAASGVATTLPPVEGKPYPHFVPAVDRDGNEVSGIRLPDLTVPLATYTGWNLRHPQMGAPDRLMSLMGSTIPFPATREERAAKGDPRRSIEERYPSRGGLSRTGAARGSATDRRRLPPCGGPGTRGRPGIAALRTARAGRRAGCRRRIKGKKLGIVGIGCRWAGLPFGRAMTSRGIRQDRENLNVPRPRLANPGFIFGDVRLDKCQV